jgi:N-carbamoyl-D-amino-acid hydrolase
LPRLLTVGAAQMGPVARSDDRRTTVDRLVSLLRLAAERGCRLVVFPEAALTPFFPHWYMTDPSEIDSYFETEMPNSDTQRLFDEAARLGIGFVLGYCELVVEGGRKRRFNSSVLVDGHGAIVGKYRKIHLPGYQRPAEGNLFENLEKYYFEVGDLGWPVWRAFDGNVGMMICNDRRWPEAYRVMGLQEVELIALGYNTPYTGVRGLEEAPHLPMFQNTLSMQAGAYQNATWVVGVAKAGVEEGVHQIGGTCIISPLGEVVAQATTEEDELVCATVDLDLASNRKRALDFAGNRRTEHYGTITERG